MHVSKKALFPSRQFDVVIKSMESWDFPGNPVVKTSPSNAGGAGSIPGWGTKILHAPWRGQKKKTKVPGGLAGLG